MASPWAKQSPSGNISGVRVSMMDFGRRGLKHIRTRNITEILCVNLGSQTSSHPIQAVASSHPTQPGQAFQPMVSEGDPHAAGAPRFSASRFSFSSRSICRFRLSSASKPLRCISSRWTSLESRAGVQPYYEATALENQETRSNKNARMTGKQPTSQAKKET